MNWTDERKEKLYAEFYPKLLRYFRAKINSPEQAEDLCSETVLKVYSNLDDYDESKSSLSTWIYTIANHVLTDFFRRNRPSDELDEELMDEAMPIEEGLLKAESLRQLADALEKLDTRERDLIIHHYYFNKPLLEVADILGVSYTYTKVLHKKALNQLRNILE